MLKKLCWMVSPLLAFMGYNATATNPPLRWVAYFGQAEQPALLQGFDVVVLDLDKHPDLAPIKASGAKVLAYIAVAEIAPYRSYYEPFSRQPHFFVGTQARWNGAKVDIRDATWQQFVIDELVAGVKAQGFDGVFLDTLDTALALEKRDPVRFLGTSVSAKRLIREVRNKLPRPAMVMVNRAFEILPAVVNDLDIVLAESILLPSVDTGDAKSDASYDAVVTQLHALQMQNPDLKIFTLDYPDLKDKTMIENVFCTQRANGFSPSIADVALQSVYETGGLGDASCREGAGLRPKP